MLLGERSQYEKTTYCMLPNIGHSGKGKTIAVLKYQGRGWVGKRDEQVEHSETILYDTVLVDIGQRAFR